MYSSGGPCIPMEGRVQLWRPVYSYGGPYVAVEGRV